MPSEKKFKIIDAGNLWQSIGLPYLPSCPAFLLKTHASNSKCEEIVKTGSNVEELLTWCDLNEINMDDVEIYNNSTKIK